MKEEVPLENVQRVAIILSPKLAPGQAANAAAIVTGGMICDAFEAPIEAANGTLHAAIRWNLVVLEARSAGFLDSLLESSRTLPVKAVAFSTLGQELSNSFDAYKVTLAGSPSPELKIVAVGLYGSDEVVRQLTKPCSLYR
jgi:hypothetical protein